ncbi:hypothetical protein [Aurantivibrio plasticivorans]
MNINLAEVHVDGKNIAVLTHLNTQEILENGISSSVIIGHYESTPYKDELKFDKASGFTPNKNYHTTINGFCEKILAKDPSTLEEAEGIENGWLYIIDQRTPTPETTVPPEDIIGAFIIEDGKIKEFKSNNNHRIVTNNGVTNFGRDKEEQYLSYLLKLR